MKNILIILLLSVFTSSCQVTDGDLLKTQPLLSLEAQASTDSLTLKKTTVSGTIGIGYTSDSSVGIRILDNGVELFNGNILAQALEIPFSEEIILTDEGNNDLIVEVNYGDKILSKKIEVIVASSVVDLVVSASETDLHRFTTVISGQIDLGYESQLPVLVTILDNGVEIFKESMDASGLSLDFQKEIHLLYDGQNSLVVEASRNKSAISREILVNTALLKSDVAFGSWQQQFVEGVGLIASGSITVTHDPSYIIDYVEFSHKENEWHSAASQGAGVFDLELQNPDIGNRKVFVRVGLSLGTHTVETIHETMVTVDPVFDCTDNPSSLMLPETDLISDQSYENRTMVGYFGDPDAHHSVEFVLSANVPGDGTYYVVGQPLVTGFSSINTQFYVSRLRCQNDPCSMTYNLDLYIDGAYICSRANFGDVFDY
jgi:hypothetical protein